MTIQIFYFRYFVIGGGKSLVAPGFELGTSNRTAILMEDKLRLVKFQNGNAHDLYDLKYTDAGQKFGITINNGKVTLPISTYSKWKHVELKDGAIFRKSDERIFNDRLPVITGSEEYRLFENKLRHNVKLPRQLKIQRSH